MYARIREPMDTCNTHTQERNEPFLRNNDKCDIWQRDVSDVLKTPTSVGT